MVSQKFRRVVLASVAVTGITASMAFCAEKYNSKSLEPMAEPTQTTMPASASLDAKPRPYSLSDLDSLAHMLRGHDSKITEYFFRHVPKQNPAGKLDEINKALGEIYEATGGYGGFAGEAEDQLTFNKHITKLFVDNPEKFAEIAKGAGMFTGDVFCTMGWHEKFAELLLKNPELAEDLHEIGKAVGNRTRDFLSNKRLVEFFINDPEKAKNTIIGAGLVDAINYDKNIAILFLNHTKEFVEIAKIAKRWDDTIYRTLENDKIAKLFASYPQEFVEIAKAVAAGSQVHNLVHYDIITEDPKVCDTLKVFGDDKIANLFVSHRQEFIDIAKVAGGYAEDIFRVLGRDKIANLFVENPERVKSVFIDIAKESGEYTCYVLNAFNSDKITELFVAKPEQVTDILIEIAKASGTGATKAFRIFGCDDFDELFVKNPELVKNMFVEIAKASGEYSRAAFYALESYGMHKYFIKNPELVKNAFIGVAKAAGEKKGDFFYLLGRYESNSDLFIKYCNRGIQLNELLASVN